MSAVDAGNTLGVLEAARAIEIGELRSIDLVNACLDRIRRRESTIGAWVYLDPDSARSVAIACDKGPRRGPLHGVPIAVKDIIDTVDMPTECGSPVYRGRRAAWDAACVALAKRAGAVILGKTVTTEFAYFAPGKTANPHNPEHTPGGSSSGTAAAVADHMVPAGFGTQTAASIIRPASFCGVVGYKPSFGTFSLAGVKGFAESFDTLGLITRNVIDVRYLRRALLGVPFEPRVSVAPSVLRIGLCKTPWWNDADAATRDALGKVAGVLSAAGASVLEANLPSWFSALADVHKLIMAYESTRSLAYEYDAHRDNLSVQLRELIEFGARIGRGDFESACADAEQARLEFDLWMDDFDLLLAPSAKGEAPAGLKVTGDPLFSRLWTLLHVPSISLPGLLGPQGLPVGVQLIGRRGRDEQLLGCAESIEGALRA